MVLIGLKHPRAKTRNPLSVHEGKQAALFTVGFRTIRIQQD